MDSLTIGDRILIVETYYTTGCSIQKTLQILKSKLDNLNETLIKFLLQKFEETGSVLNDNKSIEKPKTQQRNRLTINERVQIMKIFFENGKSIVQTQRKLKVAKSKNQPTDVTVRRLVKKFKESGTIEDTIVTSRQTSRRNSANIEAVRRSIAANPNLSLTQRCKQLGLSYATLNRILHTDLHMKPIKNDQAIEIDDSEDDIFKV